MSNQYAIGDDYQLQSKHLEKFLQDHHLWNGKDKLNFAQAVQDPSACDDDRLQGGQLLLKNLTKNGNFSVFDMMAVLRDDQSGICMGNENSTYRTTASQVSVLTTASKKSSDVNACHFFTGTPNPKASLFKPFIFSEKVELGILTVSTPSEIGKQRLHPLYAAHQKATREQLADQRLKDFEHEGILEIVSKMKSSETNNADSYETLFHDAVAAEIELLREIPSKKRSWMEGSGQMASLEH